MKKIKIKTSKCNEEKMDEINKLHSTLCPQVHQVGCGDGTIAVMIALLRRHHMGAGMMAPSRLRRPCMPTGILIGGRPAPPPPHLWGRSWRTEA